MELVNINKFMNLGYYTAYGNIKDLRIVSMTVIWKERYGRA